MRELQGENVEKENGGSTPSLNDLVAMRSFGMTRDEAIAKLMCIHCKKE